MTRRLAEMTLTRVAESPTTILVEGRILSPYAFEFVTLAHESSPRPLSRAEADARTSYRYPDPQLAYVAEGRKALRVVGTDTQDRVGRSRRDVLLPVHAVAPGALDAARLHERRAPGAAAGRVRGDLDGAARAGTMITILVVGRHPRGPGPRERRAIPPSRSWPPQAPRRRSRSWRATAGSTRCSSCRGRRRESSRRPSPRRTPPPLPSSRRRRWGGFRASRGSRATTQTDSSGLSSRLSSHRRHPERSEGSRTRLPLSEKARDPSSLASLRSSG